MEVPETAEGLIIYMDKEERESKERDEVRERQLGLRLIFSVAAHVRARVYIPSWWLKGLWANQHGSIQALEGRDWPLICGRALCHILQALYAWLPVLSNTRTV